MEVEEKAFLIMSVINKLKKKFPEYYYSLKGEVLTIQTTDLFSRDVILAIVELDRKKDANGNVIVQINSDKSQSAFTKRLVDAMNTRDLKKLNIKFEEF